MTSSLREFEREAQRLRRDRREKLQIAVRSVAFAATGIRECLPFFGDELPVVVLGVQSEFQHAKCVGLMRFAVSDDIRE